MFNFIYLAVKTGKMMYVTELYFFQVFNKIPLTMIKEKYLAEDLNVEPFMTILGKFFGAEMLHKKVTFDQVEYYYLSRFTAKFLTSEFPGSMRLGMLRQKIQMKKAACEHFYTFFKLALSTYSLFISSHDTLYP